MNKNTLFGKFLGGDFAIHIVMLYLDISPKIQNLILKIYIQIKKRSLTFCE